MGREIARPARVSCDRGPTESVREARVPGMPGIRPVTEELLGDGLEFGAAVARWCQTGVLGWLGVLPDDNGSPAKLSAICESTGNGGNVVCINGTAQGSPAIGSNLNSGT